MPERTSACVECGTKFTAAYVRKPPVTCSPECRRSRRASSKKRWALACLQCGDTFEAVDQNRRYCSRPCSAAAQRQRVQMECVHCGSVFEREPRKVGVLGCCSRECAREFQRLSRKPRPPRPGRIGQRSRVWFPACDVCGSLFAARSPRTKRCSLQCKIDHKGLRIKDLYRAASRYIDGRYEGGSWRKELVAYLVERDGDRCGICNRTVDITLKSGTRGSRKGPSVDHIIPRSLGGPDEPENWRLTHWGCNQARGNRGGGEQLALVG